MNRFRARLARADARISRAFAEALPAVLFIGTEVRPVTVIFETPDAPVDVPAGGQIQDRSPAFSALTTDIAGLEKHHGVEINGTAYRVTHVGADEEGRTRVTLAYGAPGKVQPGINKWS
ncbi:head-tail joining protein [Enterobacter asburiae]